MILREYEFFHGAALLRALESAKASAVVTRLSDVGAGCYAINDVGLLIKFARDRMSPWRFTFTADQRGAIGRLEKIFTRVGVLFVCNDAAVIVVDSPELSLLLGKPPASGSISVSRKPRGMARVSGPAGELPQKVADSDFSLLFP